MGENQHAEQLRLGPPEMEPAVKHSCNILPIRFTDGDTKTENK